jgi:hypothetical protein
MPLNITKMLLEWRNEVKPAAKRRAKRQKMVLLDDPDKWIFIQSDGCSISHPNSFNNFIKVFLY